MNKKGCLIGFLISFALIVGFIAFTIINEEVKNPTVDGFRYSVQEDGTFMLKRVIDAEIGKELTIPSEVKGKPVTAIYYDAFKDNTTLEKVIIPSSVKKVNGFSGCTNLKEVKMGEGVERIEQEAFANCTGLTKIAIPMGVKYIGSEAFKGCTGLKEITFPSTIEEIYVNAFEGCTGLTSFAWPASVKRMEHDTFKDCTNLTVIDIPEGVEVLYCTFEGCTSLTSLTIPSSVTDVWGFSECENLERITYKGTKEQWMDLHGSQDVNGKCTVYCTDGSISDLD